MNCKILLTSSGSLMKVRSLISYNNGGQLPLTYVYLFLSNPGNQFLGVSGYFRVCQQELQRFESRKREVVLDEILEIVHHPEKGGSAPHTAVLTPGFLLSHFSSQIQVAQRQVRRQILQRYYPLHWDSHVEFSRRRMPTYWPPLR